MARSIDLAGLAYTQLRDALRHYGDLVARLQDQAEGTPLMLVLEEARKEAADWDHSPVLKKLFEASLEHRGLELHDPRERAQEAERRVQAAQVEPDRILKDHPHYGAHMSHCNQGYYVDACKYGDDSECPALKRRPRSETPGGAAMTVADRIAQIDEVERIARRIAATKMALLKDPQGANLPDDLWRQAVPDAVREIMAGSKG